MCRKREREGERGGEEGERESAKSDCEERERKRIPASSAPANSCQQLSPENSCTLSASKPLNPKP